MDPQPWIWAAFGVFVFAMLALDLVVFSRRGSEIGLRRAVAWSIAWTALGLGFAAVLAVWQGREPAEEYLAGFLIEKSLSIDNLFVFALILSYFAVPAAYQRRVLFWGIVGAMVLRGVFIAGGAALLDAFHATVYVFGAFLVLTGIRMARHRDVEIHPERNPVLRVLRRVLPISSEYHGDRLTVRHGGRWVATPICRACTGGDVRRRVRCRLDPGDLRGHARDVPGVRGERVLAARPRVLVLRPRRDDDAVPLPERRARGRARLRRREDACACRTSSTCRCTRRWPRSS